MRGCNFCGAYFSSGNDETDLNNLKNHHNKCSESDPFEDDENADGYVPIPN